MAKCFENFVSQALGFLTSFYAAELRYNTIYKLGTYGNDIYKLVDKRNAFTHPDASKQDELESFDEQDVSQFDSKSG